MTIYSLYIFDRHCEPVYYQDWHRTRPVRAPPPTSFKPGVHRLPPSQPTDTSTAANGNVRESIFSDNRTSLISNGTTNSNNQKMSLPKGLPFDEEAKLVYGVILSLRNMVKKLSGRDEAFTSYSTSSYKLHLFETPTNYKFILLSDPSSDSLRFVLRQLYVGPFLEYVIRNPLVKVDSRVEGVDNDQVGLSYS
uniref:Trafficking protein particle complex subunit n=1 Tax=Kwoniella bestiolae CBS 10118 TaxID=1296100 RepID=A0A1B9GDP2_9TREE|nr:hypothetical protein I302_00652 [Kwoniella bestiolae CBS 10118]OCF29157.1 hypothetical protein I302_00652 [Kwoniella bestiolae CBS 10118]